MTGSVQGWLLLLVGFAAANLPFFNERLLLVGPRRPGKHVGWRLLELLLLSAAVIGLGMLIESRIGQRAPQGWEFYAAVLCLMLTFAFPGFVWRHLRKRASHD
ncbi:MAG: hypothetical protein CFE45_33735 [Burkholderiales bacterium PBB5]|nr:MAG: hypothetical protein CFE45_33735 [Burkholderiales bacterium PBB5]